MRARHFVRRVSIIAAGGFILFALGFGVGMANAERKAEESSQYRRVTGVGGIFFKAKDPVALKTWYRDHLGFNIDEYGATFEWRTSSDSSSTGQTQWAPFSEKTNYFSPSEKQFMFNYRVENLEWLAGVLKSEGIELLDTIAVYDYGKFAHIMDPEGNKIELWEPID